MGVPHRIGVVGTGFISGKYLATLADHPAVTVAAVADLVPERAAAVAARLPSCRSLSVAELLDDDGVDTVLNLTVPAAHAEVAVAALARGKNVYGEKPLAVTMSDARDILRRRGSAWVGAAPDTVLGTGIQTARALVDAGEVGQPLAATATWVAPGHELWHPDPDFYYLPGGGPVLDMGPYYLTTLVQLLGPVVRVSGASSRSRSTRTIGSGPRAGTTVPVEVDTHVTGVLEHASGALSTVLLSFDAVGSLAPAIEVHGERGSIAVPDPNVFDGVVRLRRLGEDTWRDVPPSAGYEGAERGIGLLDFVAGAARADGAMALHVLDVMTGLIDAARERTAAQLTTTVTRPSLVPYTPADVWRRG